MPKKKSTRVSSAEAEISHGVGNLHKVDDGYTALWERVFEVAIEDYKENYWAAKHTINLLKNGEGVGCKSLSRLRNFMSAENFLSNQKNYDLGGFDVNAKAAMEQLENDILGGVCND